MQTLGMQDFTIGGMALSYYVASLRLCVPMYLFLSGYGLYVSWQKNKKMRPFRRVVLLYLNFWIVFIIFIGLGCFLQPGRYPGDFSSFIINFTGWSATYNNHWWFLLPYVGLVFLAPLMFELVKRYHPVLVFCVSGMIFLGSYSAVKFNQDYLVHHYIVYNPILIINCSFAFITGALCAKSDFFSHVSQHLSRFSSRMQYFIQAGILSLIVLLFVMQALLPVSIFGVLFSFIFIFAFINLYRPYWVDKIFTTVGRQSTNMWLIHGFFCCFLFQTFVYSFTYPILIFVVTLALSYVSGVMVDFVYKPLRASIINRWN